uniref:Uncharacterized protein n=1 Tax=Anguilla anguilla TaxID=7936 RepID=A0A0E9XFF6_ANGAN
MDNTSQTTEYLKIIKSKT